MSDFICITIEKILRKMNINCDNPLCSVVCSHRLWVKFVVVVVDRFFLSQNHWFLVWFSATREMIYWLRLNISKESFSVYDEVKKNKDRRWLESLVYCAYGRLRAFLVRRMNDDEKLSIILLFFCFEHQWTSERQQQQFSVFVHTVAAQRSIFKPKTTFDILLFIL